MKRLEINHGKCDMFPPALAAEDTRHHHAQQRGPLQIKVPATGRGPPGKGAQPAASVHVPWRRALALAAAEPEVRGDSERPRRRGASQQTRPSARARRPLQSPRVLRMTFCAWRRRDCGAAQGTSEEVPGDRAPTMGRRTDAGCQPGEQPACHLCTSLMRRNDLRSECVQTTT